MNKLLFAFVVAGSVMSASSHQYSTTAAVTLTGGVIKASQQDAIIEKYKRKDCPVCKGKGWYLSGDGIAKINCQYCEP